MTDIHCHILPCVDDGSSSWEETMAMARCACANGIRKIYCTPHMNAETNSLSALSEHEELIKEARLRFAEAGIDILLLSGAEWMLTPELLDTVVKKGRLGTSTAFLFELSPFMPPGVATGFVSEAVQAGLRPVMAHPERHPLLEEKKLAPLKQLVDAGCILQLTAGSLLGLFGKQAQLSGKNMIQLFPDAVVLASDAHNMRGRRPLLAEGYELMEKMRPGQGEHSRQILEKILLV